MLNQRKCKNELFRTSLVAGIKSQKYTQTPKIIRENISHLALFRGSRSRDDICRIIRQYTDDPKKASKIIDKNLRERNFVVFDFTKTVDDPLAIRLGWDSILNLSDQI